MSEKDLTDKLICPYCDKSVSVEKTRFPNLQAWIRSKWPGASDMIKAARKRFNDWSSDSIGRTLSAMWRADRKSLLNSLSCLKLPTAGIRGNT